MPKPRFVLAAEGIPSFDLVLVEWEDANSTPGWFIEVPKERLLLCRSVGYLVGETKDSVTLAHTVNAAEMFGDLFSIPKNCIRNRRVLVKKKT